MDGWQDVVVAIVAVKQSHCRQKVLERAVDSRWEGFLKEALHGDKDSIIHVSS